MFEERIKSIVNGFGEAFVKRDVEKMLSFFAEDAVWVSPAGTFKGKEEIERILTCLLYTSPSPRD